MVDMAFPNCEEDEKNVDILRVTSSSYLVRTNYLQFGASKKFELSNFYFSPAAIIT